MKMLECGLTLKAGQDVGKIQLAVKGANKLFVLIRQVLTDIGLHYYFM